jgi:hypothetical protein
MNNWRVPLGIHTRSAITETGILTDQGTHRTGLAAGSNCTFFIAIDSAGASTTDGLSVKLQSHNEDSGDYTDVDISEAWTCDVRQYSNDDLVRLGSRTSPLSSVAVDTVSGDTAYIWVVAHASDLVDGDNSARLQVTTLASETVWGVSIVDEFYKVGVVNNG